MTTTLRKEDYLGRDLVNATPGTSAATDFLARSVIASDKDYLGRALTSAPWVAATAYAVGSVVYLTTGEELTCTVAGTSHATDEPEAPGEIGETVTDNTVTWMRTE